MVSFSVHTVAIQKQKVSNSTHQKILIYNIDTTRVDANIVDESEPTITFYAAVSSPHVSSEFATLLKEIKEEHTWLFDELAKY